MSSITKIVNDPLRLLSVSFLVKILVGAAALSLPGMTTRDVPVIDLLFTSTSAVCVTGLTTIDVSRDLTFAGQAVLCLLIQLGGIGIITLWLFMLSAFGSILGSTHNLASSAVGEKSVNRITTILKSVAIATVLIELAGAALLFATLPEGGPLKQRLWWSVFHAVSAFCNAGFSLHSDNLVPFADNYLVNFTIMSLIVIGGIGYAVIAEIAARPKRYSLHTLTVLSTTAALLFAGFFVLGLLEWDGGAFGEATLDGRLMRLLFLSVTPRTAGFNTIDMSMLRDSSILFIIFLMLIGASPGGTGGGFKTTPLAIVFLRFTSIISGKRYVRVGRWDLEDDTIFKAVWTIFVYLTVAAALSLALLVSETELGPAANPHGAIGLMFELVSALGTVGLSLGVTPHISFVGKCVLIAAMFVGRIGPLTFAFAIGGRSKRSSVKYVEGNVGLG